MGRGKRRASSSTPRPAGKTLEAVLVDAYATEDPDVVFEDDVEHARAAAVLLGVCFELRDEYDIVEDGDLYDRFYSPADSRESPFGFDFALADVLHPLLRQGLIKKYQGCSRGSGGRSATRSRPRASASGIRPARPWPRRRRAPARAGESRPRPPTPIAAHA